MAVFARVAVDKVETTMTAEEIQRSFVVIPQFTTAAKAALVAVPPGVVVFDTTLNKLCVRGAAAFETITSV